MTVIVNDTGFNVNYWARFSEEDFVKQNLSSRVYKEMPESERIELLKQVYKLIRDAT